jgi:hypothetical protein
MAADRSRGKPLAAPERLQFDAERAQNAAAASKAVPRPLTGLSTDYGEGPRKLAEFPVLDGGVHWRV